MGAVQLDPLAGDDHQRDAGAVFTGAEDLLRFIPSRIERHLRLAKDGAGSGSDVIAVDGARGCVIAEGVERLAVSAAAAARVAVIAVLVAAAGAVLPGYLVATVDPATAFHR